MPSEELTHLQSLNNPFKNCLSVSSTTTSPAGKRVCFTLQTWESLEAEKETCRKDSFLFEITQRGVQTTILCVDGTFKKLLEDIYFFNSREN